MIPVLFFVLWKPIPTVIPLQKQIYLEELAHKTKGAFNYVAGMRYEWNSSEGKNIYKYYRVTHAWSGAERCPYYCL